MLFFLRMNSDKPKKELSPRCKRNLIFTFLIIIFIISISGYIYLVHPSYIEKRDRAFFLEYQALMELHKLTNDSERSQALDFIALRRRYGIPADKVFDIFNKELIKNIFGPEYWQKVEKEFHPEKK